MACITAESIEYWVLSIEYWASSIPTIRCPLWKNTNDDGAKGFNEGIEKQTDEQEWK